MTLMEAQRLDVVVATLAAHNYALAQARACASGCERPGSLSRRAWWGRRPQTSETR